MGALQSVGIEFPETVVPETIFEAVYVIWPHIFHDNPDNHSRDF
jgi:hypothetical protein